jgi:hypothetical protein
VPNFRLFPVFLALSALALSAIPAGAAASLLQAHCWLDDDEEFSFDQFDGGMVYGTSSLSLREDCQLAATARFGAKGTSGLKDIKPVPGGQQSISAHCWMDDDEEFSFDQFDGGILFGTSTLELRKECQLLARNKFGEKGTSGLADIKLSESSLAGLFQGHCWLDDDLDFSFDQTDGGMVYGRGSAEVREDCAYLAFEKYGNQGTSGIKDLAPVTGGANSVRAHCWVDDDEDFSFDQFDGGFLYGRSTLELRKECRAVAKSMFGAKGTSGIKDASLATLTGNGFLKAECWIDDDLEFSFDQTDGGPVYGLSGAQLREECQEIARAKYGSNGSSGLKGLEPIQTSVSGISARCWLDDDPDFSAGQFDAGSIFGSSTLELRRECAFLAKQKYGDQGSSGIADVKLLP